MSDEQQQATIKWATIDAAIEEIGRLQEQVAMLRNEVWSWRECDQKLHLVDAVQSRHYNLGRELRKGMVATDSVGVLKDQLTDKHGKVLFDGMYTEIRWLRQQNAMLRAEVQAWREAEALHDLTHMMGDRHNDDVLRAMDATDAANALNDY